MLIVEEVYMSAWQADQLHIVDLATVHTEKGQEVTQGDQKDQGQEDTEGAIECQEGD